MAAHAAAPGDWRQLARRKLDELDEQIAKARTAREAIDHALPRPVPGPYGLAWCDETVLLRSWIRAAGLADSAAWAAVDRDERDPQQFWLSVLGALRQTSAGSALVRA